MKNKAMRSKSSSAAKRTANKKPLKGGLKRVNTNQDVKRDDDGRFAVKNSRLAVLKKFNWKRAFPIMAVVTLVGGWLVYSSFATTAKPPAYQYSIRTCGSSDAACKDKSAEAWVYRMQLGVFGRQTDEIYRRGNQFMMGNRATGTQTAAMALGYTEPRWGGMTNRQFVDKLVKAYPVLNTPAQVTGWTRDLDQKKISRSKLASNVAIILKQPERKVLESTYLRSNREFITFIFRNMLKRGNSFTAPANETHVQRLNSGALTREQVVSSIATSAEAIQKNRQDIDRYVASKPRLKITETAKQQQAKRVADAKNLNNNAKRSADAAGKLVAENRTRRDEARKIAARGSQEQAQVNRVVAIRDRINADLAKTRNHKATNQTRHNSVKRLRDASRALTQRATDIPSAAIQTEMNVAIVHLARASNAEKDMITLQAHLKTAEAQTRQGYATHQANKKRLAEAQRRASQTTPSRSGNSSQPATANCSQAVSAITRSSSRTCIRKLQAHGGITQDGIWGPNTQRVYDALHRARINTPGNNTSNANPCRVNANSKACKDALAKEMRSGSFSPSTSCGSGRIMVRGTCAPRYGAAKSGGKGYCSNKAVKTESKALPGSTHKQYRCKNKTSSKISTANVACVNGTVFKMVTGSNSWRWCERR